VNDSEMYAWAKFVRETCIARAREAWNDAGLSGLCPDGRWECALDAMASLDLRELIDQLPPTTSPDDLP